MHYQQKYESVIDVCGRFVNNRDKKKEFNKYFSSRKKTPKTDASLSHRNNAIVFITTQRCCEKAVIKMPSL